MSTSLLSLFSSLSEKRIITFFTIQNLRIRYIFSWFTWCIYNLLLFLKYKIPIDSLDFSSPLFVKSSSWIIKVIIIIIKKKKNRKNSSWQLIIFYCYIRNNVPIRKDFVSLRLTKPLSHRRRPVLWRVGFSLSLRSPTLPSTFLQSLFLLPKCSSWIKI